MRKKRKAGEKGVGSLFGKVSALFAELRVDGDDPDYGDEPAFEALESRVLLSANPICDYQEQPAFDESAAAAVYMPLNTYGTGEGAAAAPMNVAVDTEAPVIQSVVVSQDNPQTLTALRFRINATDNASVTRYTLTIDGVNVPVVAFVSQNYGMTNDYSFTEAGEHEIVAVAYDAAGNASAAFTQTVTVTERPDVTAPTVQIGGITNGWSYKTNRSLSVTVRDVDSIEVDWTLSVRDNQTGAVTVLAGGDRTVNSTTTVANIRVGEMDDGLYTYILEAVDKAGHSSRVESSVRIDRAAPVVTVDCTDRLEAQQEIWFTLNAEDDSAITTKSLTINGTRVTLDAKSGRGKYTFASPGQYTLVATATDQAGNVGTYTRVITVTENTDLVAPSVTIHSPADGLNVAQNTAVSVRASIGDVDSDHFSWTVRLVRPNGTKQVIASGDGAVQNAVVAEVAGTLAGGRYGIEIEAVDPAGNTTIATSEFSKYQRAASPRLNGSIPPDQGEWINQPKLIGGSIIAGDCPIELVDWTFKVVDAAGQEHIVGTGTGQPADGAFGWIVPANYVGGKCKLVLETVDIAGNVSSQAITRRIDGRPPVYTGVETTRYSDFNAHIKVTGYDDCDKDLVKSKLVNVDTGYFSSGFTGFQMTWVGCEIGSVFRYNLYLLDTAGNEILAGTIVAHHLADGDIVTFTAASTGEVTVF